MSNQIKIILIYFYQYSDYIINDLLDLLGLTYKQFYRLINKLIEENYLEINLNGILQVAKKGIVFLQQYNLESIDNLFLIYAKKNPIKHKLKPQLDINRVFIPKKFDKKFSLYYNSTD